MDIWVVKHRVGAEVLEEKIIASSREELFAIVRSRGIHAISCARFHETKTLLPIHSLRSLVLSVSLILCGVIVLVLILFLSSTRHDEQSVNRNQLPASIAHKASSQKISVELNDSVSPPIGKIQRVIHPVTGEEITVTQKIVVLKPNAGIIGQVYSNNVYQPPKRLFKTYSENYIVGLMRTEAGMPAINLRLPKNFDEEFKARIADPVEILPDDTEEDIALKNQMVELKHKMAELIAEGFTPTEIIKNERNEINRLARIRTNAMKDLAELRRNGATKEEVELYVEAANKMMDEYGVKHIKLPLEKLPKISIEQ